MKLRVPMYYKEFKCVADKCKHSCCLAGWEIDIDGKTAQYYNSVEGEFGDKLHDNISFGIGVPTQFKLNKDGSCPFFNECGLCDIYINLGEDKLCQICTDHPRYYEWFKGVKEAGIGLCCEESARIILSQKNAFSTSETDIPDEECDEYDDEVYEYLCKSRDKIITYLDNNNISIMQRIKNVLWYGNMVQLDLDSGLLDDEEIIDVGDVEITEENAKEFNMKLVDFLFGLEPNNQDWKPYLKQNVMIYENSSNKMEQFEKENPEIENYLKNIAIYFAWRYFLKGVFDGDVLSKLKLMCFAVSITKWLMYCKWLNNNSLELDDCIDIVRRLSEELEYSNDNIEWILDECQDNDFFETNHLLNNMK